VRDKTLVVFHSPSFAWSLQSGFDEKLSDWPPKGDLRAPQMNASLLAKSIVNACRACGAIDPKFEIHVDGRPDIRGVIKEEMHRRFEAL
jgi:hypothetical protein